MHDALSRSAPVGDRDGGQHQDRRGCRKDRQLVKADAKQYAQRRGHPQRSSGCEAADVEPFAKDYPAAQKADAGQNTMRHAHWIDADHLYRRVVEPRHLMYGRQHQQAAGQAYQDMRAQPGRTSAIFAFAADNRAGQNRADDRPEQVGIEQFQLFGLEDRADETPHTEYDAAGWQ